MAHRAHRSAKGRHDGTVTHRNAAANLLADSAQPRKDPQSVASIDRLSAWTSVTPRSSPAATGLRLGLADEVGYSILPIVMGDGLNFSRASTGTSPCTFWSRWRTGTA